LGGGERDVNAVGQVVEGLYGLPAP